MNRRLHFINFALILSALFFFSCGAMTSKLDTKVLLYENSQIIKDYEKEKRQLINPQIDNDDGYCPLCEL